MAITTPYSLQLNHTQSAHEVTADTVVTVVADNMKIFLGSSVDPAKRQSIIGSLTSCLNELMVQAARGADTTTNPKVSRCDYLTGTSATVTVESVTTNVAVTDVAIVVAGDFGSQINQTIFYKETLRKLTSKLLENSAEN